MNKKQSNYGYFPDVAKSLLSPFVPQSSKNSPFGNNATYEDTWYFDDESYDEWDEYYYDDTGYSDDSYDEENDYYYDTYDDTNAYDMYGEDAYYYDEDTYYYDDAYGAYNAYDQVDSYEDEYEDIESDDCWWDYWCGNDSLNDSVGETYEDWYYGNRLIRRELLRGFVFRRHGLLLRSDARIVRRVEVILPR